MEKFEAPAPEVESSRNERVPTLEDAQSFEELKAAIAEGGPIQGSRPEPYTVEELLRQVDWASQTGDMLAVTRAIRPHVERILGAREQGQTQSEAIPEYDDAQSFDDLSRILQARGALREYSVEDQALRIQNVLDGKGDLSQVPRELRGVVGKLVMDLVNQRG